MILSIILCLMFDFICRWLSARDDDGQIIRDLPLSSTIQGMLHGSLYIVLIVHVKFQRN